MRWTSHNLGRSLIARKLDPTLGRYVESGVRILLRLLILIAILGVLGIETTSFAALLAAVGVAIGAALAGPLSIHNFSTNPYRRVDLVAQVDRA